MMPDNELQHPCLWTYVQYSGAHHSGSRRKLLLTKLFRLEDKPTRFVVSEPRVTER